jgi:CRP-like cAMP-binding protein
MSVQPKNDNFLLAALSVETRELLSTALTPVALEREQIIHESGQAMHHLLFPTTAIVSVSYVLENDQSAEIGIIGRDGVVGMALFMGGGSMPNRASVRSAGEGLQLDARTVTQEFKRGGDFQDVLLKYTQALMTQMLQTSVCNSHHSIDQRLCRWLLLTLDRSSSNTVPTTQELISRMLGVRREGITEAIGNLQSAALLEYRRGSVEIVDRAGLEERVCECYRVVRTETERLFPSNYLRRVIA